MSLFDFYASERSPRELSPAQARTLADELVQRGLAAGVYDDPRHHEHARLSAYVAELHQVAAGGATLGPGGEVVA